VNCGRPGLVHVSESSSTERSNARERFKDPSDHDMFKPEYRDIWRQYSNAKSMGNTKIRRLDVMRHIAETAVGEKAWLAHKQKLAKESSIAQETAAEQLQRFNSALEQMRRSHSPLKRDPVRNGEAAAALRQSGKLDRKGVETESCENFQDDENVAGVDRQGSRSSNVVSVLLDSAAAFFTRGGPVMMLAWPVWHWLGIGRVTSRCTCASCVANRI